jgi:hypothetical protein
MSTHATEQPGAGDRVLLRAPRRVVRLRLAVAVVAAALWYPVSHLAMLRWIGWGLVAIALVQFTAAVRASSGSAHVRS